MTSKIELSSDPTYWLRPWYPAGVVVHTGQILGHLDAECPELLRVEPNPREGAGWLDPRTGDVCLPCLREKAPDLYDALFSDEEDEDEE
ncbi:hypothetical protein [Nonomuraea sp. NPDC050202]|uniref:hypothetical protein n=1 Tax=Nonomuraea sp. NPDC050202 TaxID=3155035 RepID=UPI0033E65070